MVYSLSSLSLLALTLFATGVWVESRGEDPQIFSAVRIGGVFAVLGAGTLGLLNVLGPLP